MKQYIFSLLLLLPLSVAYADAADGYAARIAELERQVARLTEQVNHLLAERLPPAPHGNAVYVCQIKAFTDTFRSEHRSQGRAEAMPRQAQRYVLQARAGKLRSVSISAA